MRNAFLRIFLILLAFMSFWTARGGIEAIRINEVLVKNETNYVDPYGVRCSWFEVFNTGYAMVDLGGCYVTNDIKNPTKYRIPKGNPKTKIAARTYALFFAYDKGDRGIFHVNFSLEEKGFLAIYDQSGGVLLDSVSYDISAQKPDHSFGKMENEKPIDSAKWHYNLDPTPEAANYTTVVETRAEKYKRTDPHGFIITVTTMAVVFTVLLSLAFIFTYTGRYFKRKAAEDKAKRDMQLFAKTGKYIQRTGRYIKKTVEDIPIIGKEKEKAAQVVVEEKPIEPSVQSPDDLDIAAIATALYLHFDDQHEVEQTGFWLNRPLNHQTAWTAKSNLFKKSPIRK
jgi:Na+-transporting methylmalonyl-CoA/oxaloacetate decarboxylase gamma subunit